jgi:uncharacterized membrane protein YfhO
MKKKQHPTHTLSALTEFPYEPAHDISSDGLARLFAGVPSGLALLLSILTTLPREWGWQSILPTLTTAVMISVMASFFLSLVIGNGDIPFFRKTAIIMTITLTIMLYLIGGVSFGMMLAVVLLFALFSIGEWLCLD